MKARKKSKKRLEMGEEQWAEYQRVRNLRKANRHNDTFMSRLRSWNVLETKRRIKQTLLDLKGNKCERCGYSKNCHRAMHFHHLDPSTKTLTFSDANTSLEAQIKELEKCILVCANCHAEIHWEEDNINVEKNRAEFGGVQLRQYKKDAGQKSTEFPKVTWESSLE